MSDDLKIDPAMMGRMAGALSFICGQDHPAVKALKLAAETKSDKDVKAARTQFMRLKMSERTAALTMARDDD
jgi:hypothetical protein